jgi:hypothetical protein
MNASTTDYIERIAYNLAEWHDPDEYSVGDVIPSLGVIYEDYLRSKHAKGIEIITNEYSDHDRMMKSLDRIFDHFAWQKCGLNGDWSVQAYHYGFRTPNLWDGDYYITDQEDGTFDVVKYYPAREENCVESIQRGFKSIEDAKGFTKRYAGTDYHES